MGFSIFLDSSQKISTLGSPVNGYPRLDPYEHTRSSQIMVPLRTNSGRLINRVAIRPLELILSRLRARLKGDLSMHLRPGVPPGGFRDPFIADFMVMLASVFRNNY